MISIVKILGCLSASMLLQSVEARPSPQGDGLPQEVAHALDFMDSYSSYSLTTETLRIDECAPKEMTVLSDALLTGPASSAHYDDLSLLFDRIASERDSGKLRDDQVQLSAPFQVDMIHGRGLTMQDQKLSSGSVTLRTNRYVVAYFRGALQLSLGNRDGNTLLYTPVNLYEPLPLGPELRGMLEKAKWAQFEMNGEAIVEKTSGAGLGIAIRMKGTFKTKPLIGACWVRSGLGINEIASFFAYGKGGDAAPQWVPNGVIEVQSTQSGYMMQRTLISNYNYDVSGDRFRLIDLKPTRIVDERGRKPVFIGRAEAGLWPKEVLSHLEFAELQ